MRAGGTRTPRRRGPARGPGRPARGPAAIRQRGPGLPVPGPDDGPAGQPGRPRGSCRATPAGCWASRATPARASTTTRCSSTRTWPRARPATARAQTIGRALVYLQAHDRAHDGRLRNGYAPAPLNAPNDIQATDPASSTGTWPGPGRLWPSSTRSPGSGPTCGARSRSATGSSPSAATRAGRAGTRAARPRPGQRIGWKSTEHNIDLYRVVPQLAGPETGDPVWSQRAAWARRFFVSACGTRRRAGSTSGPPPTACTPNDAAPARGRQQLVLPGPARSRLCGLGGLGRVQPGRLGARVPGRELLPRVTDAASGTRAPRRPADALEFRDPPGDPARARSYLAGLSYAQAHGPDADGLGIMAASHDGLATACGGT